MSAEPVHERSPQSAAPRAGLRVLVVDDEPAIGRMVSCMLQAPDYRVAVVTSGQAAIDRLRARQFDVILSDLGIGPGMNGLELLAFVRRDWPDVRFILATGSVTLDADAARAAGVDEVLTKPYRPADLRRVIESLHPQLHRDRAAWSFFCFSMLP